MNRTALVAAIALSFAATPALAQDNSQFHGAWQCQISYAEYGQGGQWLSGFQRTLELTVNANGQYRAQGVQIGIGGNEPFQSQGEWKAEQGQFSAVGPETLQTAMFGVMPGQFGVFGKIDPQGRVMNFQYPQTPMGQQHIGPRTSYMCEKRS